MRGVSDYASNERVDVETVHGPVLVHVGFNLKCATGYPVDKLVNVQTVHTSVQVDIAKKDGLGDIEIVYARLRDDGRIDNWLASGVYHGKGGKIHRGIDCSTRVIMIR